MVWKLWFTYISHPPDPPVRSLKWLYWMILNDTRWWWPWRSSSWSWWVWGWLICHDCNCDQKDFTWWWQFMMLTFEYDAWQWCLGCLKWMKHMMMLLHHDTWWWLSCWNTWWWYSAMIVDDTYWCILIIQVKHIRSSSWKCAFWRLKSLLSALHSLQFHIPLRSSSLHPSHSLCISMNTEMHVYFCLQYKHCNIYIYIEIICK